MASSVWLPIPLPLCLNQSLISVPWRQTGGQEGPLVVFPLMQPNFHFLLFTILTGILKVCGWVYFARNSRVQTFTLQVTLGGRGESCFQGATKSTLSLGSIVSFRVEVVAERHCPKQQESREELECFLLSSSILECPLGEGSSWGQLSLAEKSRAKWSWSWEWRVYNWWSIIVHTAFLLHEGVGE